MTIAINIPTRATVTGLDPVTLPVRARDVSRSADVTIVSDDPSVDPSWFSVRAGIDAGTLEGAVVFDPRRGRTARPGTYGAALRLSDRGKVMLRSFEVDVRPHACIRLERRAEVTYNPVTSVATADVSVWNCGNVDSEPEFEARWCGQRVAVSPRSVVIGAGGFEVIELTIAGPADGPCNDDITLHTSGPTSRGCMLPVRRRRSVIWSAVAVIVICVTVAATLLVLASGP